jgi:CelD/BcsL family acetyltransferase involved in cellulose biosynthesis
MNPIPPATGRRTWCPPLKYNPFSPVRIMVFFSVVTRTLIFLRSFQRFIDKSLQPSRKEYSCLRDQKMSSVALRARPVMPTVRLYDSFTAVEAVWRQMEGQSAALLTPYQRFDLLHAWQRHVGARKGVTPLIAVGFDADDAPACLLPLGRRTIGAVQQASFLGGKHANFNSAIWRRDIAERIDAGGVLDFLQRLAPAADALILLNQPRDWDGLHNPLLLLPHSPSADRAYFTNLAVDFKTLLAARMSASKRKKLRNRERALGQHGPVAFRRAETAAEAFAILSAFHEQKAQRMRELGIDNVFAEPGVADFLAQATGHAIEADPVIELYALYAGERIAATSAGVVANGRFSTMFNSIARDELAQASPGQLLLTRLVESVCARDLRVFDLGIGEASYKEQFCNEPQPLFDTFLPLSAAGRMIAAAHRAAYAAKRTFKRTPILWSTVQATRRWRSQSGRER